MLLIFDILFYLSYGGVNCVSMQFSGFINDCLSGRSQIDWNYYSTARIEKDIF